MSSTGYKLLGFVVWHGGIWFVRHRYGRQLKVAAAGAVALGVVGVLVAGARQRS